MTPAASAVLCQLVTKGVRGALGHTRRRDFGPSLVTALLRYGTVLDEGLLLRPPSCLARFLGGVREWLSITNPTAFQWWGRAASIRLPLWVVDRFATTSDLLVNPSLGLPHGCGHCVRWPRQHAKVAMTCSSVPRPRCILRRTKTQELRSSLWVLFPLAAVCFAESCGYPYLSTSHGMHTSHGEGNDSSPAESLRTKGKALEVVGIWRAGTATYFLLHDPYETANT